MQELGWPLQEWFSAHTDVAIEKREKVGTEAGQAVWIIEARDAAGKTLGIGRSPHLIVKL